MIYLVKLAVSRATNKKEAGLSREESDQQHTECQEPTYGTNLESKPIGEEFNKLVKQDSETQTEVVDSEHVDTNLQLTPQQSLLTFGAAIPPLTGTPPPPPPMPTPEQLNQANGAPAPKLTMQTKDDDMFAGIKNVKLKETGGPSMPKANNDLL